MFAPVVRIKATGRYVFLLGWARDKRGAWHAHVAWLAREHVLWRGVDVWMRAVDLEPVPGQNYRRVPRYVEEPDF
ncbi:hypothetical protein GCM10023195_77310 [Actinoallomurus liliacearum]|uniref:DUF4160 domain-containing protein n=2 Tax=Actinoallomurus liliacearum TaxID=1080073 RepID=A0ABP8TVA2_9ACTN